MARELRVFATYKDASEAFIAERGVGHYFTRMEVVKGDGSRVRFLGLDSSDPVWQMSGLRFTKITAHPDCNIERLAYLHLLLRCPNA